MRIRRDKIGTTSLTFLALERQSTTFRYFTINSQLSDQTQDSNLLLESFSLARFLYVSSSFPEEGLPLYIAFWFASNGKMRVFGLKGDDMSENKQSLFLD
ncbi:unnamed protein product [Prunus brigantina]